MWVVMPCLGWWDTSAYSYTTVKLRGAIMSFSQIFFKKSSFGTFLINRKTLDRQTLDRQALDRTNSGQTDLGQDKPWTGQTLDRTNPGQDKPWTTQILDRTNPE
jgi:hypothetical protein